MVKLLILILSFTLLALHGCGDKGSDHFEPLLPQISKEDLEGEWKGRLTGVKVQYETGIIKNEGDNKFTTVDTTIEKRFSDLPCNLKFESAMYFLEMYYSDLYNSSEWGQWELGKNDSGKLGLNTVQTSWEVVENFIGNITGTHKRILKNPESWNCDVEYKADTLRLYNIENDLYYGEMKLVKQISE